MHAHDTIDLLRRLLGAPSRNHFFYGKRMDVQHFQMEQDYGKHKQWLLNKLTLGKGVLCGLEVSVDGDRICVEPGVALDGLGREIVVPVRACIDPAKPDGGCCTEPMATPRPHQEQPRAEGSATVPAGELATGQIFRREVDPGRGKETRDEDGSFTVWLCYHECFTDQQPVLVTDCDTRSHCAPGTVVESFCLKVTPGLPPLQRDPDWCLNWATGRTKHLKDTEVPGQPPPVAGVPTAAPSPGGHEVLQMHGVEGGKLKDSEYKNKDPGRRNALCSLLDGACDDEHGDVCVPLAAGMLRDGRIVRLESCMVRPRVYSNTVLLDLILCLAERVDACCNGHTPAPPAPVPPPVPQTLLRVAGVTFLSRTRAGAETVVAEVASPLDDTKLKIKQQVNAIRVRFTEDFSQTAPNLPTTHTFGDGDPDRHNVQVLPRDVINNLPYVPGTLTVEDKRTVRFDLFTDSPYARTDAVGTGWQKGAYTLLLFGDDAAAAKRHAITDTGRTRLDGEAIAPAGGAISGNGAPGGTFKLVFTIS
ncbi:hypothetical protein [Ramlibacter sp.]|uniref:hypothetical protein n=1 Tax=Ramlibacter sp. TaxID=1917967 RepID=UPI00178FA9CF|nr:hypothetical protein [Ramlibacter sp.]MBA2674504.1 hypothetical protein [Ramlibacter sp.]